MDAMKGETAMQKEEICRPEALIGKTPLVRLEHIERVLNVNAKIFAKCECYSLTGSVKDRVAVSMIDQAERQGLLSDGAVIIEPTSGNTGIGLAAVGIARGYKVILTMPENMSVERRSLLKAYGAEVVLTSQEKGMAGAIEKAKEMVGETAGAFMPGQFDNPANPLAHEKTTGPEIWQALDGQVDVFIAGVGTGGTITGVGRFLKKQNPLVQVIAVEPADSPVLSGGKAGFHSIEGIGAGFIPSILDVSVYNEVVQVTSEDAYSAGRLLAEKESLLAGVSSGAALWATLQVARRPHMAGKNIVVLLPDTGTRYLSTAMFQKQ